MAKGKGRGKREKDESAGGKDSGGKSSGGKGSGRKSSGRRGEAKADERVGSHGGRFRNMPPGVARVCSPEFPEPAEVDPASYPNPAILEGVYRDLRVRSGAVLDDLARRVLGGGDGPEMRGFAMFRHDGYGKGRRTRMARETAEGPALFDAGRHLAELQRLDRRLEALRAEAARRNMRFEFDALLDRVGAGPVEAAAVDWLVMAEAQGLPWRDGRTLLAGLRFMTGHFGLEAKKALADGGPLLRGGIIEHDGDDCLASREFRLAPEGFAALTGIAVEEEADDDDEGEPPCAGYHDYLDLIDRRGRACLKLTEETEQPDEDRYAPGPPWRGPSRWMHRYYGYIEPEPHDALEEAEVEYETLAEALACERKSGRWRGAPLGALAHRFGLSPAEEQILVTLARFEEEDGGRFFPFAPPEDHGEESGMLGKDLLASLEPEKPGQLRAKRFLYGDSTLIAGGLVHVADFGDGRPETMSFRVSSELVRHIDGQGPLPKFDAARLRRKVVEKGLYSIVAPSLTLDDVVLPEADKEKIRTTLARLEDGKDISKKFSVEDKIQYGRTAGYVFHGPSGTGKTMAAEAIAGELGRKLMVVDVAGLLSMWVGGTEKNIRRLFDQATKEKGSAVIFFDEADSLFYAREGAVRSWETKAVNQLLTRIEQFEGVAILATNRQEALDGALQRRVRTVVAFRRPDAAAREAIWRWHLADCDKLASDVDFARLARDVELTGGEIKNAVQYVLDLAAYRRLDRLAQSVLEEAARTIRDNRWKDDGRRIGFGG